MTDSVGTAFPTFLHIFLTMDSKANKMKHESRTHKILSAHHPTKVCQHTTPQKSVSTPHHKSLSAHHTTKVCQHTTLQKSVSTPPHKILSAHHTTKFCQHTTPQKSVSTPPHKSLSAHHPTKVCQHTTPQKNCIINLLHTVIQKPKRSTEGTYDLNEVQFNFGGYSTPECNVSQPTGSCGGQRRSKQSILGYKPKFESYSSTNG
jgi:hypothetical protein